MNILKIYKYYIVNYLSKIAKVERSKVSVLDL